MLRVISHGSNDENANSVLDQCASIMQELFLDYNQPDLVRYLPFPKDEETLTQNLKDPEALCFATLSRCVELVNSLYELEQSNTHGNNCLDASNKRATDEYSTAPVRGRQAQPKLSLLKENGHHLSSKVEHIRDSERCIKDDIESVDDFEQFCLDGCGLTAPEHEPRINERVNRHNNRVIASISSHLRRQHRSRLIKQANAEKKNDGTFDSINVQIDSSLKTCAGTFKSRTDRRMPEGSALAAVNHHKNDARSYLQLYKAKQMIERVSKRKIVAQCHFPSDIL